MVHTPVSTGNVTVVHRIATAGRTGSPVPPAAGGEGRRPRIRPRTRGTPARAGVPRDLRVAGREAAAGVRQRFFLVLQLRFIAGDFVTFLPL